MLGCSEGKIVDISPTVVVWTESLIPQGLDLMLLSPLYSLLNQLLSAVLLTLAQPFQVFLGYFWCIFPVNKEMLGNRYMNLLEFLIDSPAIPEDLLGLQVIDLFGLVLLHILYGLFERVPVRVESY